MPRQIFQPLAHIGTLALALGLTMPAARAETHDYEADTLSGGWGGLRQELSEKGWDWEIGYRADMISVLDGGLSRGGRPISHLDVKLRIDLEKACEWPGGTAYFNLIDDRGGKPNADRLGSLLGVSNIEVPVATSRLFHAWLQKEWAEGQWSLLMGLYPIDSEFMVVESAGIFLQPPYGALADLALSRGPSIFNNAALGLRGKWVSGDRSLYAQGAVLDGVPGDPRHPVGTRIRFDRGDGSMGIVEFGYRPVETGQVFEPVTPDRGTLQEPEIKAHESAEGYGKYAFGLWTYSARPNDLVDLDGSGASVPRRNTGWYALAEKTVWPGSPVGDLALFARYSQNDGNSIPIRRSANLGLNLKGALPGRADDALGIAYSRAAVGGKYRALLEGNGVAASPAEAAWEITYRLQANRWLALQPVLQIFHHPGAESGRGNARLAGLRMDLAF